MENVTLKNMTNSPVEVLLKSNHCRFIPGKNTIQVAAVDVEGAPMVKKLVDRGLLKITKAEKTTGKTAEKPPGESKAAEPAPKKERSSGRKK